jgi:hypothetical protein
MMPGGGMTGWGGYGFGMGIVGWLFMPFFWGLIIVGLVLIVPGSEDKGDPNQGVGPVTRPWRSSSAVMHGARSARRNLIG